MSAIEWLVVIGGVAAIAWINWYFFLAQGRRTDLSKGVSSWKRH
ncbi:MAG: hypothetical protein NW703_14765 [Nitrospiraceae bacterium]